MIRFEDDQPIMTEFEVLVVWKVVYHHCGRDWVCYGHEIADRIDRCPICNEDVEPIRSIEVPL